MKPKPTPKWFGMQDTCAYCGKQYVVKREWCKYCSTKCRHSHHYALMRLALLEKMREDPSWDPAKAKKAGRPARKNAKKFKLPHEIDKEHFAGDPE